MKIRYQKNLGHFIRPCPCSPDTVSCGYFNLDLISGCPFDCSYCILQIYLKNKAPVFYNNFEQLLSELTAFSVQHREIRLGSGELCDSLAFEKISNYSQRILKIFSRFPEIVFEFKTKAAFVEKILRNKIRPANILFSWSLNPQKIIRTEEQFTANLAQRLTAMKQIVSAGYRVGFHFDPIIIYPKWKTLYRELVLEIKKTVSAKAIGWWSLGALRFNPALKAKIFEHKNSKLFYGELILGYDGKYRYYRPLRIEAFNYLKHLIRSEFSSEIPLYLCMESKEIWQEVFPQISPLPQTINSMLYQGFWRDK